MIRKIVKIDEGKCTGCGACATACHEGAIAVTDGKARLIRDDYCDGMGDCLPECPVGAISFEEREAPAYDALAAAAKKNAPSAVLETPAPFGKSASQLRNWPVEIKLAPLQSSSYDGAELLIAADCTAYAYADFHRDFISGRTVLVGCPKLDGVDYSVKLTEILLRNDIKSITLTRMEVPCCGGLAFAVKNAMAASGKDVPLSVVTISAEGEIL